MTKKKSKFSFIGLLFDCLNIAILLAAFYPIARWYYQAQPPMGVDFYQFPTYVRYLSQYLTMPPMSWKYIWFGGTATITDYAWLFFYLAMPFAKIWGWVMGSKIFALVTAFLYFLFSYFLLKLLAKNRCLALAVSIALMWTSNFFRPFWFGGNVTYGATQFFLPLIIWLMAKYYLSREKKFFFLSVLFGGLSYWGHAGTALIFIWMPALLFLFFWWDDRNKLISVKKIKDAVFYILASMAIGFLLLYGIAYKVLTIPKAADFSFFEKGGTNFPWALKGLLLSQNIFLLIGAIILIVLFMVKVKLKHWRELTPFIILGLYISFFEALYLTGRNPFGGGILPPRTYWFFAFVVAGLIGLSWRLIFKTGKKAKPISSRLLQILIPIIIFLAPLDSIIDFNYRIFETEPETIGLTTNFHNCGLVQSSLGTSLLGDSILLEKLNVNDVLIKKNITEADKEKLKGYLIPEWMDYDDINYRFHTLEVGVNIWWSILFDLPITHGAYDSTHYETNNYAYWTDMAFHGELVTNWDHPLVVAKNDLLFLIDWQAIRYLLGNEVEIREGEDYLFSKSIGESSSLADYLIQDPTLIDRQGLKDEPTESKGRLNYFRIKEEAVSPIIKTTKVPTMLVLGEPRTAYENIIRNLAHLNLNSRYVIPVKGPSSLDKVSLADLKDFDLVFLQYYQASQQAWKKLEKYVQEGGNLIIETGGDVKESDSTKQDVNWELPAVFPVKQTTRGPLGQTWDLSFLATEPLLKNVYTQTFGALKYEDDTWNISYSEPSLIKEWAQAVLNQSGKPFLVSGELGQGKVIWSGLNLSYHYNHYFSQAEGQLIKNILASMIELKDEGILDFKVERPRPEQVIIEASDFKGAVFKENNYGGWSAKLISPYKKKLKIYNAGLGHFYVPLPKDVIGPAKIELNYRGTLFNWFFFILAIIVCLWLIKKSITDGRKSSFLGKINIFNSIKKAVKEKTAVWWEQE